MTTRPGDGGIDDSGIQGADALVLHADDDVATTLRPLPAGHRPRLQGSAAQSVGPPLLRDIALCHKFALRDLPQGANVVKYGQTIGRATQAIAAGEHVHVHNLVSTRGR